jgi:rare lipoprotein A
MNNKASYYHDRFHGQETSNGEFYDKNDFTAAHKTLPFNTLLLVTNKQNNKSVVVRVNDRGPFIKSRVIDLSRAAAKKIGMVPFGVIPVKIEVLKFLDSYPIYDSLLSEHDVWDCYGNKTKLKNISVFIWRTDNWKHAFYMASSLTLDFKIDALVVLIAGQGEKRNYFTIVTDIKKKDDADKLIQQFKKAGFSYSKIFKSVSQ